MLVYLIFLAILIMTFILKLSQFLSVFALTIKTPNNEDPYAQFFPYAWHLPIVSDHVHKCAR
jgi:hypothetical protein